MGNKSHENRFLAASGAKIPLIGGAMYPCSNPELVSAVSKAGGMGMIQPLSLTYVHHEPLREGMRKIRVNAGAPVGLNVIVEKSSKIYEERAKQWVDVALEEGIRFFVTALGNPSWVVEKVKAVGGVVYHDVTERKWALIALESGVSGLICVNRDAGGHAGVLSATELFESLKDLGVPLVAAGGVGDEDDFASLLRMGYDAVQIGTRLIATEECTAHMNYKQAILKAHASDIVRTERVTGVPLAVIAPPGVKQKDLDVGPIGRYFLKHRKTRHYMRMFYSVKSIWSLKRSFHGGGSTKDYFQAGKSVEKIEKIEKVSEILGRFAKAFASL